MKHLGSIVLETDRLILRKLKIEDAQEIFNNWTSDSEVAKYVRWNTHKSIEETKQWLAEEEKNYKDIGYYTWGLELKQTRECAHTNIITDEQRKSWQLLILLDYRVGKARWKGTPSCFFSWSHQLLDRNHSLKMSKTWFLNSPLPPSNTQPSLPLPHTDS